MHLKCNYCDPKGEKSIDTTKDDYIKNEKKKYYHTNCYVEYLIAKKKKTLEEARQKADELKLSYQEEIQEAKEKDEFLQWIKNFYDGSLPSFFLKKLQEVRIGENQLISEPIRYSVLLDMYQVMAKFLQKNAQKKQFKTNVHRMNYDLAVVLGNYGDYKKYKEKKMVQQEVDSTIEKQIDIAKKIKQSRESSKIEDSNFDIADVMDELLL